MPTLLEQTFHISGRAAFKRSLLYYVSLLAVFPVYLGIRGGFGHIPDTLSGVLAIAPAIIPSPLAILILFLPVIIWNAHEAKDTSKTVFFGLLWLLALYLSMLITEPMLTTYLIVAYAAALGLEQVLVRYMHSYAIKVLAYVLAGPMLYWIFAAYAY